MVVHASLYGYKPTREGRRGRIAAIGERLGYRGKVGTNSSSSSSSSSNHNHNNNNNNINNVIRYCDIIVTYK